MTAAPEPAAGGALPAGGAMRVMGAETEYGIHAPSAPSANATMMSARVVQAYAQVTRQRAAGGAETRWDYTDEEPLHDARGWTVDRSSAHPSQLTDQPPVLDAEAVALAYGREELELDGQDESGTLLMNMVLGNGARLYVDHAHPEYSSPEVTNPRDAVRWDAAGDLVALAAVRRLAADPDLPPVNLYKNNTDNKSVSYGSHENYLMPRSVPFGDIVRGLTPFFVSRQIMCGSGRVGIGQDASTPGYQISQRADFFEAEVGLETTIRRPIINTRDEPHATADKYRRLHVIIGDANLSQVSNYLKFGTTAMVLSLIEAGLAPKVEVYEPVAALQTVSHDTTLTARLRLLDGRRVTALDLQWMYHEAAAKLAQDTGVGDKVDGDGHTHDVLERWAAVLTQLDNDRAAAAPRWNGWPNCRCSTDTGNVTGWNGTTPGWDSSTSSGQTSGRKRACTTGSSPGTGCRGSLKMRRLREQFPNRRRTPGHSSAAGASAASARMWWAPAGTPSSSMSRDTGGSSACPPGNPSGEPKP